MRPPGIIEIILILVIVFIIFGAGKLPEIGSGIGKGIRNFKKATNEQPEKITSPNQNSNVEEKT